MSAHWTSETPGQVLALVHLVALSRDVAYGVIRSVTNIESNPKDPPDYLNP